jgi:hypothetical protein
MKIRKPAYLIQPRGLRARLAMQALTPALPIRVPASRVSIIMPAPKERPDLWRTDARNRPNPPSAQGQSTARQQADETLFRLWNEVTGVRP